MESGIDARFAEPSLLILASLSTGPEHGYAPIKGVDEIAGMPLGPRRVEQTGAARPGRGVAGAGPTPPMSDQSHPR